MSDHDTRTSCPHGVLLCIHCPHCATAARIGELRTAQGTLEARIADLESDLLQLRSRVADLEHRTNDRQTAHNMAAALLELRPCA